MPDRRYHTLKKIETLAERAATPGERAAALAAAARLRAKLPTYAQLPPLPDRLMKRVHGLLRSVEEARPKDRAALLWWSASKVREKRAAADITFEELTLVLAHLRAIAMSAGLDAWSTERAIGQAMKQQPRDRR